MLLKAQNARSPWEAPGWENLLSTAIRQDLPYPMAILCCRVTNMGNMVKNDLLETNQQIKHPEECEQFLAAIFPGSWTGERLSSRTVATKLYFI